MTRRLFGPIRRRIDDVAENFMEYHHLPWVHPELCNVSGFRDHYRFQGPGMYTAMVTSPLTWDPATVDMDVPAMPGLDATERQTGYWIMIFPSIALFLLPSHLFTILFRTEAPGLTAETADMLVHPEVLAAPGAEKRIRAIQDVAAVEGVQQGLQARAYPGGRMCFRFEEPVHRFQNMVIDLMTGRLRIPPGDREDRLPVSAVARR